MTNQMKLPVFNINVDIQGYLVVSLHSLCLGRSKLPSEEAVVESGYPCMRYLNGA